MHPINYPTLHPTPRLRWIEKPVTEVKLNSKGEEVHVVTWRKFCIALAPRRPAPEPIPEDCPLPRSATRRLTDLSRKFREKQMLNHIYYHMDRMERQRIAGEARRKGDLRHFSQPVTL